jgi:hypothetical protein
MAALFGRDSADAIAHMLAAEPHSIAAPQVV